MVPGDELHQGRAEERKGVQVRPQCDDLDSGGCSGHHRDADRPGAAFDQVSKSCPDPKGWPPRISSAAISFQALTCFKVSRIRLYGCSAKSNSHSTSVGTLADQRGHMCIFCARYGTLSGGRSWLATEVPPLSVLCQEHVS